MIIIGITGSIGMGKTTVSKMLRILKIPVFDSDRAVKEILEKNYVIIEKISKIWPESILLHQNRSKMTYSFRLAYQFLNLSILQH